MNFCGACAPRPFVAGDRTRHAECVTCGLHTDCVVVESESSSAPIRPRAFGSAPPLPPRARLVPSLRFRR